MSAALQADLSPWSTEPDPGIYTDVPEDDYHAAPGVSVSRLKLFSELPARIFAPKRETASLRFGSMIHATLLLGEDFVRSTYIISEHNANSNAHKALKAQAEAERRGFTSLKELEAALRI